MNTVQRIQDTKTIIIIKIKETSLTTWFSAYRINGGGELMPIWGDYCEKANTMTTVKELSYQIKTNPNNNLPPFCFKMSGYKSSKVLTLALNFAKINPDIDVIYLDGCYPQQILKGGKQ